MKAPVNYRPTLLDIQIHRALSDLGYQPELIRKLRLKPYSAPLDLDWQPDYTLTTFEAARLLKLAPSDLAIKIARSLESQKFIKKSQPAGPYINFALADDFIIRLLEELHSHKNSRPCKGTILLEMGNISIGECVSNSLLSNLTEATRLSHILDRLGKPSAIILRLNDWGFSAASAVLGKTSASNIPIRKVRQLDNKLQSHDKDTLKTYLPLRQRWLESIKQELQKTSAAKVRFIGNYDIHDRSIGLIDTLLEQSDKIVKDPDSRAVYIQGDNIIPLISQDGSITTCGYDLSSLLLSIKDDAESYVIYDRGDFMIPKDVVKTMANKTSLIIKEVDKIAALPEHFIDKLVASTRFTGKSKSAGDFVKLSKMDRCLALTLILYPFVIKEASEKLSVDTVKEYARTIAHLIRAKELANTPLIENATVYKTFKLVLNDINEALATQF